MLYRLTILHQIFSYISHIQTECGKYMGTFHYLLLRPHNIAMGMNNVMCVRVIQLM